ncbi:uncharacterized protein GLRG_00132 [Colletotrichum graminicola M1.001]|uniref:Uncharacterized protein n=1 Tax=Colletotrichum graminicola (strain M1.001 / M2 / FGSC 10212) TaxID=645133 RepID=E3Q309_COLGM|nr:uncharacterized protein GLRG_00132 [Colletotrichum graminicola M1.001]EFQ24988.1 hypothetical protein GLRG_00132 [Colletotrichum graminicola M1.001]
MDTPVSISEKMFQTFVDSPQYATHELFLTAMVIENDRKCKPEAPEAPDSPDQ